MILHTLDGPPWRRGDTLTIAGEAAVCVAGSPPVTVATEIPCRSARTCRGTLQHAGGSDWTCPECARGYRRAGRLDPGGLAGAHGAALALREWAADFRRNGSPEAAARLEALADLRETAAAHVHALAVDFRAVVANHLRLAVRLDEWGKPAEAAEHRDIADRYEARAVALEVAAATWEAD